MVLDECVQSALSHTLRLCSAARLHIRFVGVMYHVLLGDCPGELFTSIDIARDTAATKRSSVFGMFSDV